MHKSVSDDLLDLISSFNKKLPLNSDLRIPYHYPPSEHTIIDHLSSTDPADIFSDNEFYDSFEEKLGDILLRREYFSKFFQITFYYTEAGVWRHFDMHLREDFDVIYDDSADESDLSDSTSDSNDEIIIFDRMISNSGEIYFLGGVILNTDNILSSNPAA